MNKETYLNRDFIHTYICVFFLFTLSWSSSAAQAPSFEVVDLNPLVTLFEQKEVYDVSVDPDFNLYIVDKKLNLTKFDADFNKTASYKIEHYSEETLLLADNLTYVYLYHPKTGEIIILNTDLKEVKRLNYNTIGTGKISALGSSNDYNFIWLFNTERQSLMKLSTLFEIKEEIPINGLEQPLTPYYLNDDMGNVHLVNDGGGVYGFNYQGYLDGQIMTPPAPSFHVNLRGIYYLEGSSVQQINIRTKEKTTYKLANDMPGIKMTMHENYIAVIDYSNNLKVYAFEVYR